MSNVRDNVKVDDEVVLYYMSSGPNRKAEPYRVFHSIVKVVKRTPKLVQLANGDIRRITNGLHRARPSRIASGKCLIMTTREDFGEENVERALRQRYEEKANREAFEKSPDRRARDAQELIVHWAEHTLKIENDQDIRDLLALWRFAKFGGSSVQMNEAFAWLETQLASFCTERGVAKDKRDKT